jgi:uncharacterized delta-60 repeat protein
VAVQADGKILVAGTASGTGSFDSDFALARYNIDGSLDSSFGDDGRVTTDFAGRVDRAFAVAVQADGKIVVAGYSYDSGIFDSSDFALVRYNTDGSLDTSFGGDGRVTSDFAGSADIANAVAVQADGKIVVAGSSR